MPSLSIYHSILFGLAAAARHRVDVGKDDSMRFNPNTTIAAIGDIVVFHFYPLRNSVAQGDYNKPCQALEKGFYSGYFTARGHEANTTFEVTVNSTEPMWFYNTVPGRCQSGMVGVINPPGSMIPGSSSNNNTDNSTTPSNGDSDITIPHFGGNNSSLPENGSNGGVILHPGNSNGTTNNGGGGSNDDKGGDGSIDEEDADDGLDDGDDSGLDDSLDDGLSEDGGSSASSTDEDDAVVSISKRAESMADSLEAYSTAAQQFTGFAQVPPAVFGGVVAPAIALVSPPPQNNNSTNNGSYPYFPPSGPPPHSNHWSHHYGNATHSHTRTHHAGVTETDATYTSSYSFTSSYSDVPVTTAVTDLPPKTREATPTTTSEQGRTTSEPPAHTPAPTGTHTSTGTPIPVVSHGAAARLAGRGDAAGGVLLAGVAAAALAVL